MLMAKTLGFMKVLERLVAKSEQKLWQVLPRITAEHLMVMSEIPAKMVPKQSGRLTELKLRLPQMEVQF